MDFEFLALDAIFTTVLNHHTRILEDFIASGTNA